MNLLQDGRSSILVEVCSTIASLALTFPRRFEGEIPSVFMSLYSLLMSSQGVVSKVLVSLSLCVCVLCLYIVESECVSEGVEYLCECAVCLDV